MYHCFKSKKHSMCLTFFSDHLALLKAFNGWQEARRVGGGREEKFYCRANYLSPTTLRMIADLRKQFKMILEEIGFSHARHHKTRRNNNQRNKEQEQEKEKEEGKKGEEEEKVEKEEDILNQNAGNTELVKAVICAGLYPNVARIEKKKETQQQGQQQSSYKISTRKGGEVHIHPSSTLFGVDFSDDAQKKLKMLQMQQHKKTDDGAVVVMTADKTKVKESEKWIIFHEKVKTSKLYIRDATLISPISLLLFGGKITVCFCFVFVYYFYFWFFLCFFTVFV